MPHSHTVDPASLLGHHRRRRIWMNAWTCDWTFKSKRVPTPIPISSAPMPIPINSSSTRARLLFYSMPSNLRPSLANHPLIYPHGKNRFFDIDIATSWFSDIYAWVNCTACTTQVVQNSDTRTVRRVTWLTSLTCEERQEMLRIMVFWDSILNGAQRLRVLEILENALGVVGVSCEIAIHFFIEPYVPAIVQRISVADRRCFRFSDSTLFELSNAGGTPPTQYERYQLGGDVFTRDPGIFDEIDISQLGNILIYRRAGLRDRECPGLFELRMDLQERHYGRDGSYSERDEELVRLIFEGLDKEDDALEEYN
ncbi:hypothetical protein B0H19DRAFT_1202363 [Mycena capillaripes]|nr:hypothetical protein B0H19DRAFT_1202363 [Mycena capillaripes]